MQTFNTDLVYKQAYPPVLNLLQRSRMYLIKSNVSFFNLYLPVNYPSPVTTSRLTIITKIIHTQEIILQLRQLQET